ncbi:MAG: hypothetical protein JRI68_08935 [Deltaproteobacteria bacterium]|nr:hypothetical protein [Deltaproteobacteria bacterium]
MKLKDFEMAIIELAHEGVRLTIPNVVARLKVKPKQAEAWLDDLAKHDKLDVEIDEDEAIIYYRVRGLTVTAADQPSIGSELSAIGDKAMAAAQLGVALGRSNRGPSKPVPEEKRKSILAGILLGLFLPGLGLAYAGPWLLAVLGTVGFVLVWKLLGWIPLIGGLVMGTYALASALLGGLYTAAFNRTGKRAKLIVRKTGRDRQLPRGR